MAEALAHEVPTRDWPLEEIHFEAWSADPNSPGYHPPTNAEWLEVAYILRLAFATNCQTKDRLVELFREGEGSELMLNLIENIGRELRNLESTMG